MKHTLERHRASQAAAGVRSNAGTGSLQRTRAIFGKIISKNVGLPPAILDQLDKAGLSHDIYHVIMNRHDGNGSKALAAAGFTLDERQKKKLEFGAGNGHQHQLNLKQVVFKVLQEVAASSGIFAPENGGGGGEMGTKKRENENSVQGVLAELLGDERAQEIPHTVIERLSGLKTVEDITALLVEHREDTVSAARSLGLEPVDGVEQLIEDQLASSNTDEGVFAEVIYAIAINTADNGKPADKPVSDPKPDDPDDDNEVIKLKPGLTIHDLPKLVLIKKGKAELFPVTLENAILGWSWILSNDNFRLIMPSGGAVALVEYVEENGGNTRILCGPRKIRGPFPGYLEAFYPAIKAYASVLDKAVMRHDKPAPDSVPSASASDDVGSDKKSSPDTSIPSAAEPTTLETGEDIPSVSGPELLDRARVRGQEHENARALCDFIRDYAEEMQSLRQSIAFTRIAPIITDEGELARIAAEGDGDVVAEIKRILAEIEHYQKEESK